MALNIPFSPRPVVSATQLPLTLISLEDWALVQVNGADQVKYLQGQLTLDVPQLATEQHQLCGHCDAKGKMFSNLRLFHRAEGLAYLLRRSVLVSQLAELKKYAVFSKVTIEPQEDAVLLGVAGEQAREALAPFFVRLPDQQQPVLQQEETTLLHFSLPVERFLLISSERVVSQLVTQLSGRAQFNASRQWLALEIEAGYPVIDAATSAQLLPQATNLQALDGISFNKGCYMGQEMVARAKFRGANKRALYWLEGVAEQLPQPGDDLELKLEQNWRRTGTVLATIRLADGRIWVQVVMNNDLAADSLLRVSQDDSSQLQMRSLPYAVVC
ncbi:tRNA-modifying protein YgfZ [Serratia microhaemolytica]|uniref:tRNA-modifying protein YgfZ n=1 Tax=Serratia microhaemolytica TaxID=2675110 RepID=UPI000FDE77F3|nr:tRNA-modifying protein YgfZ [Serratia microhaemolytica]